MNKEKLRIIIENAIRLHKESTLITDIKKSFKTFESITYDSEIICNEIGLLMLEENVKCKLLTEIRGEKIHFPILFKDTKEIYPKIGVFRNKYKYEDLESAYFDRIFVRELSSRIYKEIEKFNINENDILLFWKDINIVIEPSLEPFKKYFYLLIYFKLNILNENYEEKIVLNNKVLFNVTNKDGESRDIIMER